MWLMTTVNVVNDDYESDWWWPWMGSMTTTNVVEDDHKLWLMMTENVVEDDQWSRVICRVGSTTMPDKLDHHNTDNDRQNWTQQYQVRPSGGVGDKVVRRWRRQRRQWSGRSGISVLLPLLVTWRKKDDSAVGAGWGQRRLRRLWEKRPTGLFTVGRFFQDRPVFSR